MLSMSDIHDLKSDELGSTSLDLTWKSYDCSVSVVN